MNVTGSDTESPNATIERESEPAEGTTDGSSVATDDIFHILQTERRRHVLRYLREREGPIEMRDLAEHVAAHEYDTTVDDLTSSERQRVYISLYQSHLPKLDTQGIITYDKNRGLVEPTARTALFDPYLDLVDAEERDSSPPWPVWYVSASGIGCVSIAAAVFGILSLPLTAVTATVVTLFSVLSGVHLYSSRR